MLGLLSILIIQLGHLALVERNCRRLVPVENTTPIVGQNIPLYLQSIIDDDDGDESPTPEPRTDSRSALPREIRAWWRIRVIKRDETFSLIFSPRT